MTNFKEPLRRSTAVAYIKVEDSFHNKAYLKSKTYEEILDLLAGGSSENLSSYQNDKIFLSTVKETRKYPNETIYEKFLELLKNHDTIIQLRTKKNPDIIQDLGFKQDEEQKWFLNRPKRHKWNEVNLEELEKTLDPFELNRLYEKKFYAETKIIKNDKVRVIETYSSAVEGMEGSVVEVYQRGDIDPDDVYFRVEFKEQTYDEEKSGWRIHNLFRTLVPAVNVELSEPWDPEKRMYTTEDLDQPSPVLRKLKEEDLKDLNIIADMHEFPNTHANIGLG